MRRTPPPSEQTSGTACRSLLCNAHIQRAMESQHIVATAGLLKVLAVLVVCTRGVTNSMQPGPRTARPLAVVRNPSHAAQAAAGAVAVQPHLGVHSVPCRGKRQDGSHCWLPGQRHRRLVRP